MADERRNEEKGKGKADVGREGSSEEKKAVKEVENLNQKVYLDRYNLDVQDPELIPSIFVRPFQNAKFVAHYSDNKLAKEATESLRGLCTELEIRMIANACPKTLEEAYTLLPSLRDKRELVETPLKEVVLPTLLKLKVEEE